ncbi:hypothetical protein KR067_007706 [Drosophila pandora]|nr:hypothetical protein KR067_007706 [Drosophila pandora]
MDDKIELSKDFKKLIRDEVQLAIDERIAEKKKKRGPIEYQKDPVKSEKSFRATEYQSPEKYRPSEYQKTPRTSIASEYQRIPETSRATAGKSKEPDYEWVPKKPRAPEYHRTSDKSKPTEYQRTYEEHRPDDYEWVPEKPKPSEYQRSCHNSRPTEHQRTSEKSRPTEYEWVPEKTKTPEYQKASEKSRPTEYELVPEKSRPSVYFRTSEKSKPTEYQTSDKIGSTAYQKTSNEYRPPEYQKTYEKSRPTTYQKTYEDSRPDEYGWAPLKSKPSGYQKTYEKSRPPDHQRTSERDEHQSTSEEYKPAEHKWVPAILRPYKSLKKTEQCGATIYVLGSTPQMPIGEARPRSLRMEKKQYPKMESRGPPGFSFEEPPPPGNPKENRTRSSTAERLRKMLEKSMKKPLKLLNVSKIETTCADEYSAVSRYRRNLEEKERKILEEKTSLYGAPITVRPSQKIEQARNYQMLESLERYTVQLSDRGLVLDSYCNRELVSPPDFEAPYIPAGRAAVFVPLQPCSVISVPMN